MIITQDYIKDYFKQEENLFMLWKDDYVFSVKDAYFPVEYISVFISLSGTIDFMTNLEQRHVEGDTLQFFVNDISVRITGVSDDYRSVGVVFSKKFWSAAMMSSNPFAMYSVVQPCICLQPAQKATLMEFIHFLHLSKTESESDGSPIVRHIISGLFNQIGQLYEQRFSNIPKVSGTKVMSEFKELLEQNYMSHRDVAFYAGSLDMSKSAFTELVRKATGLSAFRCIEKFVILKICMLLTDSLMSVKEIAFFMNFEDTSYFCKYFRKNTGQSPEEYRKRSIPKVR